MRDALIFICVLLAQVGGIRAAQQAEPTSQRAPAPPGTNEPSVTEGQETLAMQKVKSITFIGNRKYKDKVLRQRLDFEVGDQMDPVLAEAGRRIIATIYRKIGFAFAQVTLDWEKLSNGEVLYTIDEGPRVEITSVKFAGNTAVKSATLRKIIKLKKEKWFYWPFYYTQEAVAEDVTRLENFYYERGFLDYHITAETVFTEDKSKVMVTFAIDEGPAYQVERISFIGNEYFDQDRLATELELAPDQVYRKGKAEADAKRLLKLYGEHGFIDARVQQRPRFIPEVGPDRVNVEFSITEGSQFRIGQIEITGNEVTQDRVIRRVLDEYQFTPGQVYNADKAPKQGNGLLEKYVQRMVLAEEVMIRPVTPASGAPDQKDVKVDLKERPTGWINPGIGVSSDYGMIGQLMYEQRNFDITDWPESVGDFITMRAFRGAGQQMRIILQPGTEVSTYSVNFTEPYWRDRPTSLNVSGSSFEWYRESYNEGRLRSYIGFEQRLEQRWRKGLSFRAENVDVKSVDYDAPQEIWDVKGDNVLLGVKLGIGRSMIDDIYDPSKGDIMDADYEQLTGDHTFGILSGAYAHYTTLYEDVLERKTVLKMKVRAATTLADAPPFEKFYAGGTGTYGLRGFEYRGISPRGWQTNIPNPQREDPIGSDWVFLATTELIVPLIGENFDALVFLDSGTVETGPYRASVGAGIQIRLPYLFGPVPMRFEIGLPIKKDDDDETRPFSFSVGRLF